MALSHAGVARAQGWSAAVSAGRLVYDPLLVDFGTNNLMGTIRYDSHRDTWVYGSVATPFGDSGTFWGATGAGGRLMLAASHGGQVSYGADVGAHGFSFTDRVADQSGTGGAVDVMPFARVSVREGFVEGRGGWRGQALSFAGLRESHDVFEYGARGGYGTRVRVVGETYWTKAAEGTYPFIGGTVAYQTTRLDLWGQMGRWVATDLTDRVWSIGSAFNLGVRTSIWGTVRQEGSDPLYWNTPRRSWTVGLTQRLGRVPAPLVPGTPTPDGGVFVRLAAADAPGDAVFVAGDFNNWQPVPMQREGNEWVIRLSLAPGIYHYTFRTANGDWFVPPTFAGRRGDGMGGYHAVLIVG
jgi:hypothetical protein